VVGAISGQYLRTSAYSAVNWAIDAGAYILFAILFLWQMPHLEHWAFVEWKSIVLLGFHCCRLSEVLRDENQHDALCCFISTDFGAALFIWLRWDGIPRCRWSLWASIGLTYAWKALVRRMKRLGPKNIYFPINYLTILFIIIGDTVHVSWSSIGLN
jgi:heme O synthase-like polyprenyltransferase